MPPQSNALLLTVDAQPPTDDWFGPDPPTPDEFAGGLPVYYDEKIDRRASAGGSDVVVWRMLTIDDTYPIDVQVGKVLTWRWRDQVLTGKVQAVERNDLPGIPAAMRTTDLVMELG
jgi:hypothetical protein